MTVSGENGTANIEPAVNRQEETDEYVSGIKLFLRILSITLVDSYYYLMPLWLPPLVYILLNIHISFKSIV